MGLFDTIRVKKAIKCPNCEADCKDFQTKQLDCFLDVFKEGITKRKITELTTANPNERNIYGFPMLVPTKKYHYQPHPTNRDVLTYNYCKCGRFVNQRFRFDSKGKLKRVGKAVISEL